MCCMLNKNQSYYQLLLGLCHHLQTMFHLSNFDRKICGVSVPSKLYPPATADPEPRHEGGATIEAKAVRRKQQQTSSAQIPKQSPLLEI
jgi:hypothetical protein